MALFFRVAWSPAGRGSVLLLYGTPDRAEGPPEAPNVLLSDNLEVGAFIRDHCESATGPTRRLMNDFLKVNQGEWAH